MILWCPVAPFQSQQFKVCAHGNLKHCQHQSLSFWTCAYVVISPLLPSVERARKHHRESSPCSINSPTLNESCVWADELRSEHTACAYRISSHRLSALPGSPCSDILHASWILLCRPIKGPWNNSCLKQLHALPYTLHKVGKNYRIIRRLIAQYRECGGTWVLPLSFPHLKGSTSTSFRREHWACV